MLESVAIEILAKKTREYADSFKQEHVDELLKLWKDLQRDIQVWDVTDARIADQKQKALNAKNKIKITIDDYEEFNGMKSSDFSEENWERLKQGKPLKLLKIFMPKRLNARNSVELWDRKIYIAKKTADFIDSKLFHAYDLKTGIFLAAHRDKKFLIEFCKDKILKFEEEIDDAR